MPVKTRAEMAKAFNEEGEQMGLKKDTLQKLIGEDIDTSSILRLCSDQDINAFHFSRGQTLVVKQWVSILNCEEISAETPPLKHRKPAMLRYTTFWARWRLQWTPEGAPPPTLSVSLC